MEPFFPNPHSMNNLLLVSDGSSSPFQKDNDLVWALNLDSKDTPLFCLHSTLGLRAKSFRLFPNIYMTKNHLIKSKDFKQRPTVTNFTTSTLQILTTLINNMEFQFDFFVPEPDELAGKIKITNIGNKHLAYTLEVAVDLVAMDQGIPAHALKVDGGRFTSGQAGNLYPVLFMNGGTATVSNPYPALCISDQIAPEQSQTITWTLAAKTTRDGSLKAVRRTSIKNWQIAAQKRIIQHAKNTLHIHTGDPEWDRAFLLAQTNARSHLLTTPPPIHAPLFIKTRHPDQSSTNDPPPDPLDGLTVLELNHLAEIFLPAHSDLVAVLIEQFLSRVSDQGHLLSRFNTTPFLPAFQECPLLTSLCLQIYEINQDNTFLQRVFPVLSRLLKASIADRFTANDTFSPTWENPQQCQIDSGLFNFDFWEPTGCGLDIKIAESPALAAMLYREVKAINKISEILHIKYEGMDFRKMERTLKQKINQFWSDALTNFTYLDKQSHTSQSKTILSQGHTNKTVKVSHEFSAPMRLQLHLFSADSRTRVCSTQITGKNASGKQLTETFRNQDIRWINGIAHLTSQNLFSALHTISFTGLNSEDRYKIETADLTQPDITCLLPIWSGGVSKKHLHALLRGPLNPQNPALQFGIRETWPGLEDLPEGLAVRVNVMWNSMIIEGLSRAGFNHQSMQLFTKLMVPISKGLMDYKGFYAYFDSLTGCPCGQRGAIQGLVPVRLFLQIAGIRLFSPTRVAVWGENPFPWPVDVHWQGLYLHREGKTTVIQFPDGTKYENETINPVVLTTDDQYETEIN